MNNNPLQQYFRRPALHMKLPSNGVYYPAGVIDLPESGELPVFPMTAIDEITVKTPDALFNGSAIADLIKSCVPNIKNPWAINSVDLDAILIAIKTASSGNEMELETTCPKCGEQSTYGINLMQILTQLKNPNYAKEFELGELRIKFKPLTYKEINTAGLAQFELQREFVAIANLTHEEEKVERSKVALEAVTRTTMEILTASIESIQTPTVLVDNKEHILDFLINSDATKYNALRDHQAELRTQTEIQPFQMKCRHCENEYLQPFTLNTSDFFG